MYNLRYSSATIVQSDLLNSHQKSSAKSLDIVLKESVLQIPTFQGKNFIFLFRCLGCFNNQINTLKPYVTLSSKPLFYGDKCLAP